MELSRKIPGIIFGLIVSSYGSRAHGRRIKALSTLFELAIERTAVDAEDGGGAAFVAVHRVQDVTNVVLFGLGVRESRRSPFAAMAVNNGAGFETGRSPSSLNRRGR